MSTVQAISRLRDLRYQGDYAAIEGAVTEDPVAAEYASVVHTICPAIRTFWDAWYNVLPDAPTVLRPYVDDILDTRTTPILSMRRSLMCLDWLVRVYAPTWLSLVPGMEAEADRLRGLTRIDDLAVIESRALQNACQDVWVLMWDRTTDVAANAFELSIELAAHAGGDAATMCAWRLIGEETGSGDAEAAVFRARDAADRALALTVVQNRSAIAPALQSIQTETLCLLRELIAAH